MLALIFSRFLRILITSMICSLSICLGISGIINDKGVLFLSFITFIIVTGIDGYHFSFVFWKIRDYFLGQLLPLVIYICMGFLTCLIFRPVVFNRMFLPLRFAGCFEIRTHESIAIIGIVFIIIVTVLRFIGARLGYLQYKMNEDENEY